MTRVLIADSFVDHTHWVQSLASELHSTKYFTANECITVITKVTVNPDRSHLASDEHPRQRNHLQSGADDNLIHRNVFLSRTILQGLSEASFTAADTPYAARISRKLKSLHLAIVIARSDMKGLGLNYEELQRLPVSHSATFAELLRADDQACAIKADFTGSVSGERRAACC